MNARGPIRSMSQPESGIDQVITAMKNVNPHCTSDNFQPVPDIIGWTNMVQAYCRFPIMIIATTAAHSRNQRFNFESSLQPSSQYDVKLLRWNTIRSRGLLHDAGTRREPCPTTAP